LSFIDKDESPRRGARYLYIAAQLQGGTMRAIGDFWRRGWIGKLVLGAVGLCGTLMFCCITLFAIVVLAPSKPNAVAEPIVHASTAASVAQAIAASPIPLPTAVPQPPTVVAPTDAPSAVPATALPPTTTPEPTQLPTAMLPPTATSTDVPTPKPTAKPQPTSAQALVVQPTAATAPPKPAPIKASIAAAPGSVSAGSYATVSVHTAPGATCDITVIYKSGPSTAQGLYERQADGNGDVSWTWKVGTRTTPGTWPVIITCGKQTLRTSVTVT
jgi:hypothetical protein